MSYLLSFDLLDDLRHPGCPMCRAAARVGRQYLNSLMVSDINDPRVREQIGRSGGLCREHVLLAVEEAAGRSDRLGMALLSELLLEIAANRLRKAKVAALRPRFLRPSQRERLCPACTAEAVITDGYADILVDSPGVEVMSLFEREDRGLCLPHAVNALARARNPSEVTLFADAWSRPARRMRKQLKDLIRKHAYNHRHEAPGVEADSWRLAPSWVVGTDRSYG